MMRKISPIPFDFVLEKLGTRSPSVKPMFGCHAVYVRHKIVVILRKKGTNDPDNGGWIATTAEHHNSLKREFPSMRSIALFGKKESAWQVLPEDADDFEESVFNACELILKGDQRIGKVPAKKELKTS